MALEEFDARVSIGRYGRSFEQQSTGDAVRVSLPEELAPADLAPAQALKLLQEKEDGPEVLGHHPQTGEPIFVLSGRFGPYVQLGDADANGGKPRPSSLLKGMKPQDGTLDVAVQLLSLPRPLGLH